MYSSRLLLDLCAEPLPEPSSTLVVCLTPHHQHKLQALHAYVQQGSSTQLFSTERVTWI